MFGVKTRMAGLQSGEGRMMINTVVWAKCINVIDRQPRRYSKCHANALRRAAKIVRCIMMPCRAGQ